MGGKLSTLSFFLLLCKRVGPLLLLLSLLLPLNAADAYRFEWAQKRRRDELCAYARGQEHQNLGISISGSGAEHAIGERLEDLEESVL